MIVIDTSVLIDYVFEKDLVRNNIVPHGIFELPAIIHSKSSSFKIP